MQSVLPFLIPLTMAAVLLVLLTGIFGLVRGGAFNRKYANVLMRWRIGLQALAVALLMLSLWLAKG